MGLYDRGYMRGNDENRQPVSSTKMLTTLLLLNAVIYLMDNVFEPVFPLLIGPEFRPAMIYQLFTAGFFHQDFSHCFFNCYGLYLFGKLLAPHLDGKKMLILYLSGVFAGNLLFLICNLNTPIPVKLLGASGAVCAFMAAAAMLEPDCRFSLFFVPGITLKTTTLIACYTIMECVLLIGGTSDSVAHLAHLGGFIGGYLAIKAFFGRNVAWDISTLTGKIFSGAGKAPAPPKETETGDAPVSSSELDYLLDKLSRGGINSLSEHELNRLRRAREQMRGE